VRQRLVGRTGARKSLVAIDKPGRNPHSIMNRVAHGSCVVVGRRKQTRDNAREGKQSTERYCARPLFVRAKRDDGKVI